MHFEIKSLPHLSAEGFARACNALCNAFDIHHALRENWLPTAFPHVFISSDSIMYWSCLSDNAENWTWSSSSDHLSSCWLYIYYITQPQICFPTPSQQLLCMLVHIQVQRYSTRLYASVIIFAVHFFFLFTRIVFKSMLDQRFSCMRSSDYSTLITGSIEHFHLFLRRQIPQMLLFGVQNNILTLHLLKFSYTSCSFHISPRSLQAVLTIM